MKRTLLIVALLFAGIYAASAQATLKFGHINSAELVSMMPETKAADEQLKKYTDDLNNQMQAMLGELQKKYQDFVAAQAKLADAVREIRQKEIQDMQQRVEDFQQKASENIENKRKEIYGPILEKAEKAVKEVAKEGKYSYILDASVSAVIYAQDSDNIIDLVKKKLNITEKPTSPPTNTPKK